ncbi:MAG: hypothetical protein ABI811_01065 [Acidobacteriota bacterium]
MSRPIALYRPSRRYALFCLFGALAAGLAAWGGTRWGLAWTISAALFLITAVATLVLALRPRIEIHETHLLTGRSVIFWNEIRAVERVILSTRIPISTPLILRLTLASGKPWMLLHTGDADSCLSLLRHVYRYSRSATLDGIPYREFWSDAPVVQPHALALPRPRMLLAEDEEEVERLFQQLKTMGSMDVGNQGDVGSQSNAGSQSKDTQAPDQTPDHTMDQRGADEP